MAFFKNLIIAGIFVSASLVRTLKLQGNRNKGNGAKGKRSNTPS